MKRSYLDNKLLEDKHELCWNSIPTRNLFARLGVAFFFVTEGLLIGVWSSFLPDIEDKLNLDDGKLGLAVLFVYLATVVATPIVGSCIKKIGSKLATRYGAMVFILLFPMIPLAPSLGWLIPINFAFGFGMGLMDVSMNSCAILTEIVADIPLLGSFHGTYSIAAAIGSTIKGGLGTFSSLHMLTVFLLVAGCIFFLSIVFQSFLYSDSHERSITEYHDTKENGPVPLDPYLAPMGDEDRVKGNEDLHVRLLGDGPSIVQTTVDHSSSDVNSSGNKQINNQSGVSNRSSALPSNGSHNDLFVSNPFYHSIPSKAALPPGISSRLNSIDSTNSKAASNSDSVTMSLLSNITSLTNSSNPFYDTNTTSGEGNRNKVLFFLSLIGFLASFGESSITVFSVIYFERSITDSSLLETAGYVTFMICMGIGRFCTDWLRRVLGRQLLVRVGGLLSMFGLLAVVFSTDLMATSPHWTLEGFACLGMALVGLGLSTLVPCVFSSAGHLSGSKHYGSSIAFVAGFTYTGSIVSGPLIGGISSTVGSLRVALLFDAVVLGLIFPLSWAMPPEDHTTAAKIEEKEEEENAEG